MGEIRENLDADREAARVLGVSEAIYFERIGEELGGHMCEK